MINAGLFGSNESDKLEKEEKILKIKSMQFKNKQWEA